MVNVWTKRKLHLEDLRGTGRRGDRNLQKETRTFSSISMGSREEAIRKKEETEETNRCRNCTFGIPLQRLLDSIRCFRKDFRRRFMGNSSCQRVTKRAKEKDGSLFLRQGTEVAEVSWRLYHTYFYTEYFNNNNINICKGWSAGGLPMAGGGNPRPRSKHDAHTRISLHFSCTFSTTGSSADTGTTFIQKEAIEQLD